MDLYFDAKTTRKGAAADQMADDEEKERRKQHMKRLMQREYDESNEGHRQRMVGRVVEYAVRKYKRN